MGEQGTKWPPQQERSRPLAAVIQTGSDDVGDVIAAPTARTVTASVFQCTRYVARLTDLAHDDADQEENTAAPA